MDTPSMSPDGLARLHEVMAGHVERGELPGLITLVARGDRAYVDVMGTARFGDDRPLQRDALFRIASLTKPVTAAAAMILVDDGTLRLGAPVDDLLPELANRRVLRSVDAALDDTVPATRAITIEDLLTFRLGFGIVLAPPGAYPIQRAEAGMRLRTLGPPWPPTPHTPDEWIRQFATLPLIHQPGEQWMYNTGATVLGILLERAAGRPLEAFLRDRLLDPLGMRDTAFSVPERCHRLTTQYSPDPASGVLSVRDGVEDSYWSTPPNLPDAGAWLVSTIDDYWAFVRMLLARGVHDGERILSERSVELMTTDHLTAAQRAANRMFLGDDGGWGYGMRVPAAGVTATETPGGFGWDGGSGTTWRSDVVRDLTGILFTQREMTSPEPPSTFTDFWDRAYAAIED